jgi:hypothetical protein
MSTPFEREILTHYWTSPGPFPRPTQLYHEIVDRFVKMGLLVALKSPNQYGSLISGQTDPMCVYQEALAAVRYPIPIQEWRIPT